MHSSDPPGALWIPRPFPGHCLSGLMMTNSVTDVARIALVGAGGSHPGTLAAVEGALARVSPETQATVVDMSLFDRRGVARYQGFKSEVLRLRPADFGLRDIFRTAGPNLALSGGARRFEQMIDAFGKLLDERSVGAMLICHSRGFPEQAMIAAASRAGIKVAQIDEGPFSMPVRPATAPEFSNRKQKLVFGGLRRLGLIPRRDLIGGKVDRFFITSPGRGRVALERGLDPAKLAVVPCPRFDALAELRKKWRDRTRTSETKRVLFLHQPFRADRKLDRAEADRAELLLMDGLTELARKRPIQLGIRMHPRSDEAERARIASRFSPLAEVLAFSDARSLTDDLISADAFVGFYSSALLEAAVCGAPVAAVRLDPKAFAQGDEANKAASLSDLGLPVFDDAAALAAFLDETLDQRELAPPRALIEEQIGEVRLQGSDEVARQLMALLEVR